MIIPATTVHSALLLANRPTTELKQLRQLARHHNHTAATTTTTTSSGAFSEVTLALLKPDLLMDPSSIHTILEEIHSHNIHITRRKTLQWTCAEAEQFYNEHQGRFFFNRLVGYMTSGPLMALELSGPGVVSKWRGMLGSTHPVRMRVERPGCLRARFGLTDTRNAFHGSDSLEAAKRELKFIFKNE